MMVIFGNVMIVLCSNMLTQVPTWHLQVNTILENYVCIDYHSVICIVKVMHMEGLSMAK